MVKLRNLIGFILTKFVSNVKETILTLKPDVNEKPSPVTEICNAEQSSHVLDLKWYHVQDTLVVSRCVDRPLDKAIT